MNEAIANLAATLREALLYVAGTVCLAGMLIRMATAQDFIQRLMTITTLALVVGAIAYFGPLLLGGIDAIEEMSEEVRSENDRTLNALWTVEVPEPGWNNFVGHLQYFAATTLQKWGGAGRWFIGRIQIFVAAILIAISPLTLSLFMIPLAQGTAVRFGITTLGVILWKVGFILVDMLLVAFLPDIAILTGASSVLGGAGIIATGGTAGVAILTGISLFFVILVLLMNLLYLTVPLGIAALLSGENPITKPAAVAANFVLMGSGAALSASGALAHGFGAIGRGAAALGAGIADMANKREGRKLAGKQGWRTAHPIFQSGSSELEGGSASGGSLMGPVSQSGPKGFVTSPQSSSRAMNTVGLGRYFDASTVQEPLIPVGMELPAQSAIHYSTGSRKHRRPK